MAAKHAAIGSTPTVACTRASTSRKAMTPAPSRVRTDRPWKPAWTISSESRSSGPARRARATGCSGGTQQLHQTRNSPTPRSEPQQQTGHPTAWASSADRS